MTSLLSTIDHRRDVAGLKYIYPVLSRRAGGLSIGINVNTNNACNWRCIYCQVPDLRIGSAPVIDFELLETELRWFLEEIRSGRFYTQFNIASDQQVIKDIAISGNGEPTSVKEFDHLIRVIGKIVGEMNFISGLKLVLITNGSLIHQPKVQQGLKLFNQSGGEIWFKLDSATPEGRQRINNTRQTQQQLLRNLRLAIELCPTKIQTCLMSFEGIGWSNVEQAAYLDLLAELKDFPRLPEIMLYTLARPSLQPEAAELAAVSLEELQRFAELIGGLGFKVSVNV